MTTRNAHEWGVRRAMQHNPRILVQREVQMTATDAQVRIAMSERKMGRTQMQAAAKANLRSRKTVSRYEFEGRLPSQLKEPRTHRTRSDPFEADWPELRAMLEAAPTLEAKAVFEWLCGAHPGRYKPGQLRTLQRRVREWRHAAARSLVFASPPDAA